MCGVHQGLAVRDALVASGVRSPVIEAIAPARCYVCVVILTTLDLEHQRDSGFDFYIGGKR